MDASDAVRAVFRPTASTTRTPSFSRRVFAWFGETETEKDGNLPLATASQMTSYIWLYEW